MVYHRAALLVLLCLAVASAQPIRRVVSDCNAIASAFALLEGRYKNATTGATLSMALTLNCTADWSGCGTNGMFRPLTPAISAKQPRVTITIKTDCKRGRQNMTIPIGPTYLFSVNTAFVNNTASVEVAGPGLQIAGGGVSFVAGKGSKSSLVVKDVSVREFYAPGITGTDLEKMSVTGGAFANMTGIDAYGITGSVTVSKTTFDGYPGAAINMVLASSTKVSATGNSFKAASDPGNYAIFVYQAPGKMSVDLSKTTVDGSSNIPICVTSPGNVTKPVVKVAGSVGITPLKPTSTLLPGGWPVFGACTVAYFSKA